MMYYKKEIIVNLKSLGVKRGDVLLVHSSLNAVGQFVNRAAIIIESLLEVIGNEGTLLMPALSYETVNIKSPVFNIHKTPSCVGALTEYFRIMKGVRRSIHPTHSVCGLGAKAYKLLRNHYKDNTPCGPNSPFSLLKEVPDSKILFIGCGLRPNTSMHAIEELTKPKYLFGEESNYTILLDEKKAFTKSYVNHDFNGFSQEYQRIINVLEEKDLLMGKILNAKSFLVNINPLWDKVHSKLIDEPFYFVDKYAENKI